MGQPPLDTSRPDLSRPTGQEPQPVEPATGWQEGLRQFQSRGWSPGQIGVGPRSEAIFTGDVFSRGGAEYALIRNGDTVFPGWRVVANNLTLIDPEPCSPPASQPVAEPAEPSAPSQEGSGFAVGAGSCCERMKRLRGRGWDLTIHNVTVWNGLGRMDLSPGIAFCLFCGAKLGEGE